MYKKKAGINLCAVIKYFKIKKTIVHGKKSGKTNIYNKKGVYLIKWVNLQSIFMLCFVLFLQILK